MNPESELDWEGCLNVRDLGGLGGIRLGALVRMEAPTRLTAAGWAAAWEYGVRTVIDLRNSDEISPDDSPRPAGINTVEVPQDPIGTPFHEYWTKIDNLSSPLYFPAMLTTHPEPLIAAVRTIARAEPGCIVFHCAGGKDRTGLLALVLLALAGATPEEIIADYLLTYERMEVRYAAMGAGDQLGKVERLLEQHDTNVQESLTATIASLTMPAFLLENGLAAADLALLLDRLTK
ncbi:hypothetical protein ABIB25_000754 [Nakamurella sp. UYEF19]|uniref:tyrosine-protein phosphatase n=1 Tax=Nakamurella sp. UYEF19 TaxID=1756392 RepID=UPI003396CB0A